MRIMHLQPGLPGLLAVRAGGAHAPIRRQDSVRLLRPGGGEEAGSGLAGIILSRVMRTLRGGCLRPRARLERQAPLRRMPRRYESVLGDCRQEARKRRQQSSRGQEKEEGQEKEDKEEDESSRSESFPESAPPGGAETDGSPALLAMIFGSWQTLRVCKRRARRRGKITKCRSAWLWAKAPAISSKLQEEGFEPSKALSQQISHFAIEKGAIATFSDLESVAFDHFATPACKIGG